MPFYDNPAGRLHVLLTKLREQNGQASLLNGWAAVLEVEAGDVVLRLGSVAELVRQTQEAVNHAGDDALLRPVQRNREAWARPILPPDHPFNDRLDQVWPDEDSLDVLALVSSGLHNVAPEGEVPDEDERDDIKSQIRDVIDAIQEDDDITDKMKRLLIERLRGVEEAIEHLVIGGPNAIRLATEAVVGSVFVEGNPSFWKSETWRKTRAVLSVVWIAFTVPSTAQNSIEAWGDLVQLNAGIEREAGDSPQKVPSVTEPAPAPDPDAQDAGGTSS